MVLFLVGLVIFLGSHSVAIVAPAWRNAQAARNERAWKGVYSIVSLIGLVLMIYGYGMARQVSPVVWSPPNFMRHIALLVMLPVFPLFLATYFPGRIKAAAKHPTLLAVKFWSLAHLLANGTLADVVLFGSVLVWAVLDFRAVRRRRAAGKEAPVAPAGAGSGARTAIAVVAGAVAWAVFGFWLHARLIGVSPF